MRQFGGKETWSFNQSHYGQASWKSATSFDKRLEVDVTQVGHTLLSNAL